MNAERTDGTVLLREALGKDKSTNNSQSDIQPKGRGYQKRIVWVSVKLYCSVFNDIRFLLRREEPNMKQSLVCHVHQTNEHSDVK